MEEKAILTAVQVLELTDIDDRSNHGEGWCSLNDISKDVLKKLERENYIVTNETRTSGRITAMGRKALENPVIRGSAEHGQMLLAQTEVRREPSKKPFESVMRKPNGDIPQRPQVNESTTSFRPQPKTCVVEGCNEPRMKSNAGGRPFAKCEKHQREIWSKDGAKKQRPTGKPVEQTVNMAVEPDCQSECESCTYREVVEMLRAKYPQIEALVTAVEKIREIRDGMGI